MRMTQHGGPIHQGGIDWPTRLSIKPPCQITQRLWNFSLSIKTSPRPWPALIFLSGESLGSWHDEAEGPQGSRCQTPRQSQITVPLPPTVSSATGVFNRRIIMLYILYGNPPENHGSLSPWRSMEASPPCTGSWPVLLPQGYQPRPAAAVRLPYKLALKHLLLPSQRGKTVKHRRLFKLEKIKNENAGAMKSANIEGNAQDLPPSPPPC